MQKIHRVTDQNGRQFSVFVKSTEKGSGLAPSRVDLMVKDQAGTSEHMTLVISSGDTLYLNEERKLVTVEDWWNSSILAEHVLKAVTTKLIGRGKTMISVAESDHTYYYTPVII